MPLDFSHRFVVAVSTRALFDLSRENQIFLENGLHAYESYQRANEDSPLEPGTAFPLVQALLNLNTQLPEHRQVEVMFFSRNSATTSLRAWQSAVHHGLAISRGAFTSGRCVAKYVHSYDVDLFLSADARDVDAALRQHVPAARVLGLPRKLAPSDNKEIRIAFDGDAVLFDSASEEVYQKSGIEDFHRHEQQLANHPLGTGPMHKLLISLAILKRNLPPNGPQIVIGLITARNGPAHERVIRTLSEWKLEIDEVHFLGGLDKSEVLETFGACIFFDDQMSHCAQASKLVPTGQVSASSDDEVRPCPKCGAETVLRKARKGVNAGRPFYGCSKFPGCRGSVSIS